MLATYKQIQDYIKHNNGYVPKTCWIAHMKEVCGLKPRVAPNRYEANMRTNPCPLVKQDDIKNAFRHFNMFE